MDATFGLAGGNTLLHLAAENRHGECVKILLAHKDINSSEFVIKEYQQLQQAECLP